LVVIYDIFGISMKNNSFINIYLALLLLVAQTEISRYVFFLTFPLWLILLYIKNKVNVFSQTEPLYLILILLIGLCSSIAHLAEYNFYFISRDIIYFIQAPIFIMLGMLLYAYTNNLRVLLKIIVLSSLSITLYNFSELIVNPSIIFQIGIDTRFSINVSNPSSLLTFIIIFYARKYNYKIFKKNYEIIIMLLSLLSISLSFSRTLYLLFIIAISIDYLNKSKLMKKAYYASIILVLFVIFGGSMLSVEYNTIDDVTLITKFQHSIYEMAVHSYDRLDEINNNWRGFEAYLGLSKFYEGNWLELIFGQGFGAVIHTPYWIFSGKKDGLDVIPMFHNGYITILLKTGILGILIFFLFLHKLLNIKTTDIKKKNYSTINLSTSLIHAIVFIIFFQTFVIHGIFSTTPPMLLLVLIGILIRNLTSYNKGKYNVKNLNSKLQ